MECKGFFYTLNFYVFLNKMRFIMGNVKLIFCGNEDAEQYEKQLQLYVNTAGMLFIQIEDIGYSANYTVLDKETAIKLSRELKKQISLMF